MAFEFEHKTGSDRKWPVKKVVASVLLVVVIVGIVLFVRNQVFSTGAATIGVKTAEAQSLPSLIQPVAVMSVQNQSLQGGPVVQQTKSGILSLVLDLHQAYQKKNTIDQASLVTQVDTIVKNVQSSALRQAWETLALCLAGQCAETNFLEFVRVLASEKTQANGQLILDFLAADTYWNTENTIRFSEAVTNVNAAVQGTNSPGLVSAWKKTVDCAGNCSAKTSIMFSFLEELR